MLKCFSGWKGTVPVAFDVVGSSWARRYTCGTCPSHHGPPWFYSFCVRAWCCTPLFTIYLLGSLAWWLRRSSSHSVMWWPLSSLWCFVDALDSLWDTLGEQTNAQISLYLINIFLSFPKICWIKFLFKGILINALKICGLVRSLDLFFTFLGSEWTSFIFSATFGQGTQGLSPLPYSLL